MREHSRFEKARVIGARALQISMGAPVDIKVPEDTIDPVIIAQMEYEQHDQYGYHHLHMEGRHEERI